jgi:hypothetical protein
MLLTKNVLSNVALLQAGQSRSIAADMDRPPAPIASEAYDPELT